MKSDCTFCEIIRGERPADFLYRSESVVVFKDIRPHAPVHLLIVPTRHIRSLNDLTEEDRDVISEMILIAKEMARKSSISQSGYKLLFNVEMGGGQVIPHVHLHLFGGWQ
jgi:histidine triad (HIT) family protein